MTVRSRIAAEFTHGARVTVTGKKGVIKFVGQTEFAGGEWIGVELDLAEGKNNGSLNGMSYFECREGHGLFVRRAQVKLDKGVSASPGAHSKASESKIPGATAASASLSAASSPTRAGARTSSRLAAIREKNEARKQSLAATKSPRMTIRAGGGLSGDIRSPRATPRRDSADIASPTSSTPLGDNSKRRTLSGIPSRLSGIQDSRRLTTPGGAESPRTFSTEDTQDDVTDVWRAKAAEAISEAEEAKARLADAATKLEVSEAGARELEEKLALLLRKSESALGEERLKASTVAKERAAAAAAGRREAEMETQMAELNDACEALTLDKEQLALEKEDLQEKVDELQLELDSMKLDLEHAQINARENEAAARALREAGGAGGDGSLDVKTLAEQNVQLKEALKRLHTHSVAEKSELTKSVRALEKETARHAAIKEEVDKLRAWKDAKSVELEDLMEKLDESKAYGEMVESLAAKNLELGERCGELEATITDLESSVELSEELEAQQTEEIRELQADLTRREVSLHNQKLALDSVMKELEDTKQTIDRFRDYADQLKASRDDLAAAAATDATSNSGLTSEERRALLSQKASSERHATDSRRAQATERLLQLALLDARARTCRVSMLLPGSLALAETEQRYTETDLGLCRLLGKATLALELLEVPAMEFVDVIVAANKPSTEPRDEENDKEDLGEKLEEVKLPLDRVTAAEDCSRLVREAEESLGIVQVVGQSLMLLDSTVWKQGASSPPGEENGQGLSAEGAALVSAEVSSIVREAEGLMDGLLRVIQDEGGLPGQMCGSTISMLAGTAETMGARRVSAIASGQENGDREHEEEGGGAKGARNGARPDLRSRARSTGREVPCTPASAVAALQECLVYIKRSTLAAAGAYLQVKEDTPAPDKDSDEDSAEQPPLCQTLRGLWGDLMGLRRLSGGGTNASETWYGRLATLARGAIDVSKSVLERSGDGTSEKAVEDPLAEVVSLRLVAKELSRSAPTQPPLDPAPACPVAMWLAIAPFLQRVGVVQENNGKDRVAPPCVDRAERVRSYLEQAIELRPDLEASKARSEELARELGSMDKELTAAKARREQLETLLERAEGAQATSEDLQKQVLLLKEEGGKIRQENKFMVEALEDLQESTSRLEAENRILKRNASSPGEHAAGHATPGRPGGPSRSGSAGGGQLVAGVAQSTAPAQGGAPPAEEVDASLSMALHWSRAESSRWHGRAFRSAISTLRPLPLLTPPSGGQGHIHQKNPLPWGRGDALAEEDTTDLIGDSLRELLKLSNKLADARRPPKVVAVRGAAREAAQGPHPPEDKEHGSMRRGTTGPESSQSSAGTEWLRQRASHARLRKEWEEGHDRAGRALSLFERRLGNGASDFGEEFKMDLGVHSPPGSDVKNSPGSKLRVGRLHLPSRNIPHVAKTGAIPLVLDRPSLYRVQEALTV